MKTLHLLRLVFKAVLVLIVWSEAGIITAGCIAYFFARQEWWDQNLVIDSLVKRFNDMFKVI